MNKKQIYNALNSDWWTVSMPNNWSTSFVSANIVFENESGIEMTYSSSAPYVTYGLTQAGVTTVYDREAGTATQTINPNQSRTTDGVNTLQTLIDSLRTLASQRLYDMHCTKIISSNVPSSVFMGQS